MVEYVSTTTRIYRLTVADMILPRDRITSEIETAAGLLRLLNQHASFGTRAVGWIKDRVNAQVKEDLCR